MTKDTALIQRVAAAIENTRARMDAERDRVPRSKREPYFDKEKDGKLIVGYKSKRLVAQAEAAIAAVEAG